jgi:4-amino-4-deoxy-L-arabinose transferase-like glycosyltransferase
MLKKFVAHSHFIFLIILAAFLNIWGLWRLGVGNSYYASAVKSMMTSFHNFFFVSFDSTGFISVDKAPLSLWLDTIFAKAFGFSGVAILLPHALAGTVVTILMYKIAEKIAGKTSTFFAALLITLSPVNVAVYRNNTPDSLLLVFILTSIYFVIKYFENKSMKYLILSAAMIGLGFNTKMLQAFLILPAITSVIFFFSPGKLFEKIKVTSLFLFVTAIISFSWITIVDLTPASMRPYVGGSQNNSAWNLALGYNGAQRLLGEQGIGGNPGFNVGEKGLQRLFTGEMGTQTGWLLATVILFSAYFIFRIFPKMIEYLKQKKVDFSLYEIMMSFGIIFFVTEYVFFSYASFFHSYYLNIFAVPISILFGGFAYQIIKNKFENKYMFLLLIPSLLVQAYLINQANYSRWLIPTILIAGVIGTIVYLQKNKTMSYAGALVLMLSIFTTPFVWSAYTTLQGNTATAIFVGGPSVGRDFGGMRMRYFANANNFQLPPNAPQGMPMPPGADGQNFMMGGPFGRQSVDKSTLSYLKQNYNGEKYFVAVSSSMQATGYILNENIGNVMTLGGFSGRDKAISLTTLKEKINNSEIRFFSLMDERFGGYRDNFNGFGGFNDGIRRFRFQDGRQNNQNNSRNINTRGGGMFNANSEISNWVQKNCPKITTVSNLYDCKYPSNTL